MGAPLKKQHLQTPTSLPAKKGHRNGYCVDARKRQTRTRKIDVHKRDVVGLNWSKPGKNKTLRSRMEGIPHAVCVCFSFTSPSPERHKHRHSSHDNAAVSFAFAKRLHNRTNCTHKSIGRAWCGIVPFVCLQMWCRHSPANKISPSLATVRPALSPNKGSLRLGNTELLAKKWETQTKPPKYGGADGFLDRWRDMIKS